MTGATPPIIARRDMSLAASRPRTMSVTAALEMAMPAAPPMPCTKRATTSTWIVGARAHATVASV